MIESWDDRCPLAGTCAECGLGFTWSEVLRPQLHHPRWSVEFAPRRKLPPWPPLRGTLVRCLWPWWFWRSMRMSHEMRWGRLAWFVIAMVVIAWMSFAIEQASVAIRARHFIADLGSRQTLQTRMARQQRLAGLEMTLQYYENLDTPNAEEAVARVRQDIANAKRQLTRLAAGAPPRIGKTYLEAIAEAVFTPRGGVPWSGRGPLFGPGNYPAPRHIYRIAYWDPNAGFTRKRAHRKEMLVVGVGSGLSLVMLLPLTFVLLPASRRKAKVRWRHIARVTAYSLFVPTLVATTALLVLAGGMAFSVDVRNVALRIAAVIGTFVMTPLIIAWWAAAIRNYLRMPHAWGTTIAMSALSLLLVLTVLQLAVPEVVQHYGDLLLD